MGKQEKYYSQEWKYGTRRNSGPQNTLQDMRKNDRKGFRCTKSDEIFGQLELDHLSKEVIVELSRRYVKFL